MRVLIACCLMLPLVSACATPPASRPAPAPVDTATQAARIAAESARLNAWFERKYEEELAFSPMMLSFLGRKEQNDRLDDVSEAAEDAKLAWQRASVAELDAQFDVRLLDAETRSSYEIWKYQVARAINDARFRRHAYFFEQMNGTQSTLPTFLINFHRVDNDADLRAYITRVSAAATMLDTLRERAQGAAADGIRPPRFAYDGALEQARKVIAGAPFTRGADTAIWSDLQQEIAAVEKAGGIDAAQARTHRDAARRALREDFAPAYRRLIDWLEQDRVHAAINPRGVGSTHPDGAAYYRSRLHAMTSTSLSADEIHTIGLAEVARIRGEMIALQQRVGFAGDLDAFFRFIAKDPRFRFPNTDAGRQAYLDTATAAIANMRRQLPQFFGRLPKAELVVRRVEAFREQAGAAQHYYPGTPDGSRPGIYYAHLADMRTMPIPELEVIAYHEGLPGHHLQISIAQELTAVPQFRRQADFTAYTEGWALYAEALAKEMPGSYTDPYSDFGRLSTEMWRAVRLVVDTGLHAKNWTEEEAVAYFDANTSLPQAMVRAEVRRYLVMPGQATAYKIGMLRIQALRRRAEAELGPRFDLRSFHNTVLDGGALPLDVLEQRVERWIAARKG